MMNKLTAIFLVLILALTGLSFAQESSATDDSTITDMTPAESTDHSNNMMDSDSMMDSNSMMDSDSSDGMTDMTAESEEHSAGMMDSDGMMDGDAMEDGMKTEDAMMEEDRPEWHSLELVNAITGETFTLASLSGKTVFVEPMATWCSNCSRQLGAVNSARAQFASEEMGEDFVFLALSIEGNLANEKLASHAERLGLNETMTFAVASQDLIRGISETYGRSALNPPSTPHFIIKSNGEMTEVKTGMESAQQIYDELAEAHASAMMMMEQSN